jgi:hypothetical protein
MGLLDDAIREHLELKRRRGADPTEVARDERDALTPVFSEEDHEIDADVGNGHVTQRPAEAGRDALESDSAPIGADLDGDRDDSRISSLAQETAELDMQAVMGADEHIDVAAPARSGVAPARGRDAAAPDDSLDWGFSPAHDGRAPVRGESTPDGGKAQGGGKAQDGETARAGAAAHDSEAAHDRASTRDGSAGAGPTPGQERLSFE